MNLFICRTIFQVYFASVIIERKGIKDVVFVYLSEGCSDRERTILTKYIDNYYIVSGDGFISRFLSQLKMVAFLKKCMKIKRKNYNIFFSSIDDPFIHTIISKFNFDNFYSFDDGTANYVNNSIFYVYKSLSLRVKIKYFLMGNRIKDIDDIKDRIQCHYSTNHLPNIIRNVEQIYLGYSESNHINFLSDKKYVNIYLCPHFDEIYKSPEKVRFSFLSSLGNEDVVIPHPRDSFNWGEVEGVDLKANVIAEECVSGFIAKGYTINLYGIANSTQYHYVHNKSVSNFVLDLGELNDEFGAVIFRQVELFHHICEMQMQ
ncbi:glycosyltransferase family 52 [Aeromonas caviae]|uniref:glycosyltransferase family 52 n=1 Tax=Aeromonas caviae TaxID=648 RepID=UPI002B48E383|nr:glycosyltransferase family 52 [Aeromonas caviae]